MSEGYPKAPDMQELVARFSRYDLISEDAWREHEKAVLQ
jgi:hypothetical protein